MGMKVILLGNVVDGVSVIGPFAHAQEAVEYAEAHRFDDGETDWNLADLEAPEVK